MSDPIDPLVAATWERSLPAVAAQLAADTSASDDLRGRAQVADAACCRIGEHADILRAHVLDLLADASIVAAPMGTPGPRQNHDVTISVASGEAAEAAAAALAVEGFEPWERWDRGAAESFRRRGTHRTVARTGDVSSVVRLRWRPDASASAVQRAVTPTTADWALVDLPARAWWAYPVVRVARLSVERLRGRPPHRHLGPFLATPTSVIEPLLDFAEVDADDTVVDLGCGDGRLVTEAAVRRGCRGIGVDADADLVGRARARVDAAGTAGRVRIEHGDARDVNLDEATVVLLFLPLDVVSQLLPVLVDRVRPGTRIVVHEQSPLPASLTVPPDRSELLVGDDAVTVGHRWITGG